MCPDVLRERLGELADLSSASSLLHWDMLVVMPEGGAAARAEQLATLQRIAHERLVDPGLGALLDAGGAGPIVAVTRRDREKALRVPPGLVADTARAAAAGHAAWARARADDDFPALAPHLDRLLALRRRYAECFPELEHPYDALLDDFEPGMRTAELADLLARLREGLVPLVEHCRAHAGRVDPSPLTAGAPFDPVAQRMFVEDVLAHMGVDPATWRLDVSTHPFQTSIALRDVRLTTRYDPASLESLFSTLHEFGHALYEAQVDPAFERTPLQAGASMGVHESQSRTWENMVGRSRGFWSWCTPLLARHLPAFADADADALWRAANVVRPTLVRVDADEVTYGLHIVVRFELELELVEGRTSVHELPARWRARIRELLGIDVPDDARGVLQDPHWSEGAFGYFPTYALGNLLAGQLWAAARAEIGDLEGDFAEGAFAPLREWLGERVHRHGRSLSPRELVERATGGPLDPAPYLAYLRERVESVYGPISVADGSSQAV